MFPARVREMPFLLCFVIVLTIRILFCSHLCKIITDECEILSQIIWTKNISYYSSGLLQFSTGLPPQSDDIMVLPASSIPHITVHEEDGEVRLLVTRSQGLLGRVMVEFRTVPLTAVSPDDYQVSHFSL